MYRISRSGINMHKCLHRVIQLLFLDHTMRKWYLQITRKNRDVPPAVVRYRQTPGQVRVNSRKFIRIIAVLSPVPIQ